MILPLTIFFVMASTLPFIDGILQFCFFGLRMSIMSIWAAVISFAVIIALAVSEDSNDTNKVDAVNHKYILGMVCATIYVFTHAGMDLSIYAMQELNFFLILEYFSFFQNIILILTMVQKFLISGQVPFTMVWSRESVLIILLSILCCFGS